MRKSYDRADSSRHFYRVAPPRSSDAIDADLKLAVAEGVRLLKEVTA
jgi:hypothetical protein